MFLLNVHWSGKSTGTAGQAAKGRPHAKGARGRQASSLEGRALRCDRCEVDMERKKKEDEQARNTHGLLD